MPTGPMSDWISFQGTFQQISFAAINKLVGAHAAGKAVKRIGDLLAKVSIGNVVHTFPVGLENGGDFGRIHFVRHADVITDCRTVAHPGN